MRAFCRGTACHPSRNVMSRERDVEGRPCHPSRSLTSPWWLEVRLGLRDCLWQQGHHHVTAKIRCVSGCSCRASLGAAAVKIRILSTSFVLDSCPNYGRAWTAMCCPSCRYQPWQRLWACLRLHVRFRLCDSVCDCLPVQFCVSRSVCDCQPVQTVRHVFGHTSSLPGTSFLLQRRDLIRNKQL